MASKDLADDWFIRLLPLSSYLGEDLERSYSLRQLLVKPRTEFEQKYGKELPVREYVQGGVVLGRRSNGSKGDWGEGEFASPIISRCHAQLSLSQNGHVYVTDLRSMHGSSVRPLNGSASFILEHHAPIQLLNADVLVLGKEVLAESKYHEPLKLRVQFRYPALGKGSMSDGKRKSLNYLPSDGAAKKFANMTDLSHLLDIVREQKGPDRSLSEMVDAVNLSFRLPLLKQPVEQALQRLDRVHDQLTDTKYGVPESILYPSDGEDEPHFGEDGPQWDEDRPQPGDQVDHPADEDLNDDGPEVLHIHSEPHYPELRMRSSSVVSVAGDNGPGDNGPGVWYSYSSDGAEHHHIENTEPEAQAPDPVPGARKIRVTQLTQLLDEMSPRSEPEENDMPPRCSPRFEAPSPISPLYHISPQYRTAALPSEPQPSYTGPALLPQAEAQQDAAQMEAATESLHRSPPPDYEAFLPRSAGIDGLDDVDMHITAHARTMASDLDLFLGVRTVCPCGRQHAAGDEESDLSEDYPMHLDPFMAQIPLEPDFHEEDEFDGEEGYLEEEFHEHDDFEDDAEHGYVNASEAGEDQEGSAIEDGDVDNEETDETYTPSYAGSDGTTNESGEYESDSDGSEESDGLPYTPQSSSVSMDVEPFLIGDPEWAHDNERSPGADAEEPMAHFRGITAAFLDAEDAGEVAPAVVSTVRLHDALIQAEAPVDAPVALDVSLLIDTWLPNDASLPANASLSIDAPLPVDASPPNEPSPLSDASTSPARDQTPSMSESDSSAGPITPSTSLKRALPLEFDSEAGPDAKKALIKAATRRHSTGKTIGLVLLGAAMGAVGTIAGLMQLAE